MMSSTIPDCQRAAEESAPSPFTPSPSSSLMSPAVSAVQPDDGRHRVRDLSPIAVVSAESTHQQEPQGEGRRYARRNGFCHFDLLRDAVMATIETCSEGLPSEMDDSQTSNNPYGRRRGRGQRQDSSLETPLTPRRASAISAGSAVRRTRKVASMEEDDSFFNSDDDECALYDNNDDTNSTPCSARRVLRRTSKHSPSY